MSQLTQKAIIHTFEDMLKKMPFDKITVSALVSNCGISSNTFYYHYRDIYDLLTAWLSEKKKDYFSDFPANSCWQDVFRKLLQDMKANPNLVFHLFNSLSREYIERYIFESTDDTFYKLVSHELNGANVPEKALREIAEYNSYAFLGFFLKFLWRRMDVDIDEMIKQISNIFDVGMRWIHDYVFEGKG